MKKKNYLDIRKYKNRFPLHFFLLMKVCNLSSLLLVLYYTQQAQERISLNQANKL